jgi:TetR/AcrR family tetracycline transcriptional repressor
MLGEPIRKGETMPAPTKLNQELILSEAVAILREEGLDEVTLRKLAGRLGVEAPSLYRHIGGKPRLQALMTLRLFRMQLDQIGATATWQEWLTGLGRVLWTTQSSIRDCARLVLTTGFEPEQIATMTGWVADALAEHGIDAPTALEMQLSVQALVLGLSGLADGPNAQTLRRSIPFDATLDHALGAMILGWEARLRAGLEDG